MKPTALLLSFLLISCKESSNETLSNTDTAKLVEENSANFRRYEAEMDITTVEDTPGKLTIALSNATESATKGFTNGERAEITPVFLDHREGSDVYQIECTYPFDSDSQSKTIREIRFNGTERVIINFPRENLVVTVRPKE